MCLQKANPSDIAIIFPKVHSHLFVLTNVANMIDNDQGIVVEALELRGFEKNGNLSIFIHGKVISQSQ